MGKTNAKNQQAPELWKHPHVRGEDGKPICLSEKSPETPPRAWGRPEVTTEDISGVGNTPTCVGKTQQKDAEDVIVEKHPHVRGEDTWTGMLASTTGETPPRAWGRL